MIDPNENSDLREVVPKHQLDIVQQRQDYQSSMYYARPILQFFFTPESP